MEAVLIKALGFVFVIIIGYYSKQKKMLKKEDGYIFAKIIMNITLPCALVSSVGSMEFNGTVMFLIGIGILINGILLVISYIGSHGLTKMDRIAYMINCTGFNIGNFTLPFVQSFFPGLGMAYLCMLDVGNSIMCLGGNYMITSTITNRDSKVSIGIIIKRLFSSIPLCVYFVLLAFSICNITIPTPVVTIASFVGDANGFLVMLMIGMLIELKMDAKDRNDVIKILGIRFGSTCILAILCFFFLPVESLVMKIIVLSLLSPVTTMATVFSKQAGYERDVPAAVNSLSILIGIVLNVGALMLFV